MKKITLLFTALSLCLGLGAQSVLFNNGPLVTHPGQGAGGVDVSGLDTNTHSTYGFRAANTSTGTVFRIADDFTVTGNAWVCDSIIFYSYQTGSSTTSTITALDFVIWNGQPDASTIVYGDTTINMIDQTSFASIYRARTIDLLNVQRPVMRVAHKFNPPLTLNPGTYYVDYRLAGSLSSGPWTPPITIPSQLNTGNSMQKNGGAWSNIIDTKSGEGQGMPFMIKGNPAGVNEYNSVGSVDVYPNPMVTTATVAINFNTNNTNIKDVNFVVTDILGNEVMNLSNLNSPKFQISRGELASGIYLFQVKTSTQILKTGKITIE